jgi:hypothetical protein
MFLCYNNFYGVVPNDATHNLEQFEYKSQFVPQEKLIIPGVPFLKLEDSNIKQYIKEERIVDAYTLYILNAFSRLGASAKMSDSSLGASAPLASPGRVPFCRYASRTRGPDC